MASKLCNGHFLISSKTIEYVSKKNIRKFLGIVDYEDLNVIRRFVKDSYLNLHNKDQFLESAKAIEKDNKLSVLKLRHIEETLKYPTEKELIGFIKRKIRHWKYLEKNKNARPVDFLKKDGKLVYNYSEELDRNGYRIFKIVVNPGQHDYENNIFEMVFTFSNVNVRCKCPEYYGTEKSITDELLRKTWAINMMSKPENTEYYYSSCKQNCDSCS